MGVDLRVAVHLGGGCLENRRPDPFGEPQGIDCAHDAGLDRLDGVELVMDGRGRTGKVIDLIDLQIDGVDDVVADAFKTRVSQEVVDVVLVSRKEVVEAKDPVPLEKEPFAQMRSQEAGAARDEYPLHQVHSPSFNPPAINHIRILSVNHFMIPFITVRGGDVIYGEETR